MSDTIRELIMQNRFTALQTLSTTFPVIQRLQASLFDPSQFPALYLYPGKETKRKINNIFECDLQLLVEISVLLDNTNPDAKLNDLMRQVIIAMNADRSCGGKAKSCYELENDFAMGLSAAAGIPDRALIIMTYQVKYNHNAEDPTKSA